MSKQSPMPDTDDLRRILLNAKNEIIALRRRNELLSARDEVVNIFSMALKAVPPQQGWGMDEVLSGINDALKELDKGQEDGSQR